MPCLYRVATISPACSRGLDSCVLGGRDQGVPRRFSIGEKHIYGITICTALIGMRDDSFFSFDDVEPRIFPAKSDVQHEFIANPRDMGGVLLEAKPVERAKCSICDADLYMEIFYFSGKTRKFIRCEGCNAYLFELERKRHY
ncbi:MAG: hypothetical protein ACTSUE_26830 [Promethearchaeota archaeon]